MLTLYKNEFNLIYDVTLLISANKSQSLERAITSLGSNPQVNNNDDLRCNSLNSSSPKRVDDFSDQCTSLRRAKIDKDIMVTPCYSLLSHGDNRQVGRESEVPNELSQKNMERVEPILGMSIHDQPTEEPHIIDQSKMFNEYIIEVDGIKKYQCKRCKYIFSCKRNFLEHLERKKACIYRSHMSGIIAELSTVSTNTSVIDKISSIKSITIPDKGNNHVLRDFVYDNYDYSHIDKKLALQDTFFDHKIFLSTLLSNNVNKNVFFDDRYGYFYVDGNIERDLKDKVGYILMEKLSITVTSFIRTNPLIDPTKYDHIIKLYSVEKLKYCFDTYYRTYDLVKREYIHSSMMILRTRDHYLIDMVIAVNYYKDLTLLLMGVKSLDNLHISENFDLDIPENYKAVQHRYSNPTYKYY